MKTEDDLPVAPTATEAATEEPTSGLFTDHGGDGGGPSMLSGYDGAEPSTATAPETVEKNGEKLLRLKLPSGSVYTARTERELLEQVARGKVASDQALADRENQIRDLRNRPPAPLSITQSQPPAPPIAPGEAWNPQKYLDLLGQDPMQARQYQDSFMYGGIDPVQATQYSYQVSQRLDQQMLAASFHDRNPDFPISPENSAKLMGVLQSRSLQPNIVNLEWAYGELKRNGALVPAGPGPEDDNEYEDITFGGAAPTHAPPVAPRPAAPAPLMQAGSQRRGGGAPPSPRSTGGNGSPDVVNFEDMTLEELRKHGIKIGAIKH